jgi:hypothetical protein
MILESLSYVVVVFGVTVAVEGGKRFILLFAVVLAREEK